MGKFYYFLFPAFFLFSQALFSQNVGIGTPNPQNKLEVYGSLGIKRSEANGAIWFNSGADQNHVLWNDYYGGPVSKGSAGTGFDGMLWNTYDGLQVRTGVAGVTDRFQILHDNNYINLLNSNVGIGTSTPAFKIDVSGTGRFTGQVTIPLTPTADPHAASKKYVDDRISSSISGADEWEVNGSTLNPINYSSLNVGIGTNNASEKLDVIGNFQFVAEGWNFIDNTTSAGWNGMFFRSATNGLTEGGFILKQDETSNSPGSGGEDVRFTIGVYNDFRQSASHSDELWFQGGGRQVSNVGTWDSELNTILGTPSAGVTGGYEWRVNNSTKMDMAHGGRLTVQSSVAVSQDNTSGGGIILADDGDIVDLNDGFATMRFSDGVKLTNANKGGSTVIQLGNGSSATAAERTVYFNTGQNVGVGTAAPSYPLHVNGKIMSGSATGGAWPAWIDYANTYGTFVFGGSDNAFFGVKNRGGSAGGSNDYNTVIYFGDDATDDLVFESQDYGEVMTLAGDGYLAINGAPDNNFHLRVYGKIRSNGINETSDVRYKRNISDIKDALSKLLQLRGVNYEWKNDEFPDKEFSEGVELGLIAQEIEKILPEVVDIDAEGYLSVQYSHIIPLLIEGVKEQQKIIENQQQQINLLNIEISKVDKLEEQVTLLKENVDMMSKK